MPAEIIQAQYEQLDNIANRFGQAAETNATLMQQVNQAVQALQNSGWEGKGSAAFFAEMESTTNPALQRLIHALEEAQTATLEIKQIIQQAEEEASAPFGNGEGVPSPVVSGIPGAMNWGSPPSSANPLATRDANTLFTEQNLDSLVGIQIKGEDTKALNKAMEALAKNPTGADLDKVLDDIAAARGVPADKIKADYQKFLQIREQALATARQKGLDPPPAINDFFHDDFAGSSAQLRTGKMIGDAFNIDPAIGALLNPTGGMVGPGNWAYNPSDDSAVGYHGIAHDAAGYLYNYHDLGPGYDYLGLESHRDSSNPLVGQQSGIRYWNEKLNPGLITDVGHGVGDFVIDGGERVIDTVQEIGGRIGDFIGDAADEVGDLLELVF
ncbi:MAG: hypothetical protein DHS20C20_30090 [Ardenticatenaceae bacterium]|nr:MAG: hypothetical protein DHS20C20_30090 [Ardenticatenaceae bacterium]